jgi:hypothetical protein
MSDIAGRVFSIILAVILMFGLTTAIFTQKQDITIQNYVDDAVHEFVDTSRSTGFISSASYDRLINRLDSTGNVYDIRMTYYMERQYPEFDGDEVVNYVTGFDAKNTEEILEELYGTADEYGEDAIGRCNMNTGDYFRVEVTNRTATMGGRLMGLLFLRSVGGGQITTSYGGYVGNEG